MKPALALLLLAGWSLASAGVAPALDDASRRTVVELVLLAGMPKALEARLDAFAAGIGKDLPADTPQDALDAVVGKIRDEVRPNVVLASVAADAAMRFKPAELEAAADALRAGKPADDVVGMMNAKLGRALDVELARASRRVLNDVDAEVAASTKATDAAIEQWSKDIVELRKRAEALQGDAAGAGAEPGKVQP